MAALSRIGETEKYRSFDFPTPEKIKVYLTDGDIVASLRNGQGTRETISRRPFFYQANVLHLNP